MFHGGGWWSFIRYDEERDRPTISRDLLWRVWGYATPYRLKVVGLLVSILAITGLSLIPPLLYRDLIDNAIPNGNITRLNLLALGMIGIPLVNALIAIGGLGAVICLVYGLLNALTKGYYDWPLRLISLAVAAGGVVLVLLMR